MNKLHRRVRALAASLLAVMAACVADSQAQAEWTYMVYVAADNNLEPAGIDDFLEMASVGSTDDVSIVVLFDRAPGYSTAYGDWTGTRRGLVSQGDLPDEDWGEDLGELNLGASQVLVDFVLWGVQNYPASRYAVVLWDHGNGWRSSQAQRNRPLRGVCSDDTNGDRLTMMEVRTALEDISTAAGTVDLIGFDACLMAMVEVAYELRGLGTVMVGPENAQPYVGLPYDTILADLVTDPFMSAAQLGSTTVYRFASSYGNDETHCASYLAAPMQVALAEVVDRFAQILMSEWNRDPALCVGAAYSVLGLLDISVFAEAHGSAVPGSHGLAIYFPDYFGEYSPNYNETVIQFPGVTHWDEFLQAFYATLSTDWIGAARADTQEYQTGETPLSFNHVDLCDFCEQIVAHAPGNVVWVDFTHTGDEEGTFMEPYNTLEEGVNAAGSGDTIYVKAGFSGESLRIDSPVRIRAWEGCAVIG